LVTALTPLSHDSILTVLAEISFMVVGFSMLASVFRGSNSKLRFLGFRNVAEIGLISAFGSLAPQLFHSFGWTEAVSWQLETGSFGLLLLLGFVFGLR